MSKIKEFFDMSQASSLFEREVEKAVIQQRDELTQKIYEVCKTKKIKDINYITHDDGVKVKFKLVIEILE